MKVLYVNAYGVTRHFGGHEEGGHWYNAGEPLASVPVRAEERQGCEPGTCQKCDERRAKDDFRSFGEHGPSFCEEERSDEDVEDAFHEWLVQDYKGDRSKGAMHQAFLARRKEPAADEMLKDFYEHHTYRGACRTVTHVVPVDDFGVESIKALLVETLGHVEHGNIYSVLGGEKLEIRVEEAMASAWSDYRPYE